MIVFAILKLIVSLIRWFLSPLIKVVINIIFSSLVNLTFPISKFSDYWMRVPIGLFVPLNKRIKALKKSYMQALLPESSMVVAVGRDGGRNGQRGGNSNGRGGRGHNSKGRGRRTMTQHKFSIIFVSNPAHIEKLLSGGKQHLVERTALQREPWSYTCLVSLVDHLEQEGSLQLVSIFALRHRAGSESQSDTISKLLQQLSIASTAVYVRGNTSVAPARTADQPAEDRPTNSADQPSISALLHEPFGFANEQQQALFCRLAKYNQIAALRPELRDSAGNTDASISPMVKVPIKSTETPFDIYLYASNTDIVSKSIASTGMVDLVESRHYGSNSFNQVIGMTPAFLDIGANIGWFTFNMAAAGYPVIAFEPMSQNEVLLRTTMCANPSLMSRVAYYPVGLGQTESTCYIVSHIDNVGDGFTACDKGPDFKGTDEYPIRGEMQTKLLSNMLSPYTCTDPGCANPGEWTETQFGLRGTPPIGVLKIDVEGFEPSVIEGGLDFFRATKIPYVRSEIGMGGHDAAEKYLRMWVDMGYELRVGEGVFNGPWNGRVLNEQDIRKYVDTLEGLADIHMVHKEWLDIAEKAGHNERQSKVYG
ncbi:S-adenosyl-L-methionine-dependent methyltransferase [Cladochytrium replicatum]|nr:S-adenosyl-L-methionine-dependent methyltransferase [Cladochytrium replicatum]